MATVYRARDERLKREVAVKVIAEHLARRPLWVRRFRREAELCAGLTHPNIVAVKDAKGKKGKEHAEALKAASKSKSEALTAARKAKADCVKAAPKK